MGGRIWEKDKTPRGLSKWEVGTVCDCLGQTKDSELGECSLEGSWGGMEEAAGCLV